MQRLSGFVLVIVNVRLMILLVDRVSVESVCCPRTAAEQFSFVALRPQRAPVDQSFIQACWQISQSLCIADIRPDSLL